MNLKKIFYNPYLLLFFSFIISIIFILLMDLFFIGSGVSLILKVILITSITYLVLDILYNTYLVITKIVPLKFYLPVPIMILIIYILLGFFSSFFDINIIENNFILNFFLILSIGGLMLFLVHAIFLAYKEKTLNIIKNNLSNYLIQKKKFIPHLMSQDKFIFKDFSANIIKITGFTTKEIMAMHAFGIMLKPSKKNIVAGAIGTTAQQTVDKQFGHPRSYIFEVYVENNKGFKVDEYEIERIQKIFLRGDLDDKELRSIAQAINPEVEKNIAIIYFTKHPFLSKALLRIAFKSGYFEKNSGKIYLFISKFKKEIERKITITNNQ